MAYGIVTKPIPGTAYGVGEPAVFNKDQEEKYAEYLADGSYLKSISKAEYEKLVEQAEEAAGPATAETAKVDDGTVKLTKDQYESILKKLDELEKANAEKVNDGEKGKAPSGEKR